MAVLVKAFFSIAARKVSYQLILGRSKMFAKQNSR
jgi:hypothetical protein